LQHLEGRTHQGNVLLVGGGPHGLPFDRGHGGNLVNMIHDVYDTSSERDALNRLLAVAILMSDDMARGLQARGLTRARANALWEVARNGPLTQRRIAELLHVTPRNVTTLIDALERTGFVTRTEHASDRRAVLIRLTDKGRAAAARMDSEANALAHNLFGGLSPAELATVVRALDQVAARIGGTASPS
jgi:DNA-binding MarR family transcriptional regulator